MFQSVDFDFVHSCRNKFVILILKYGCKLCGHRHSILVEGNIHCMVVTHSFYRWFVPEVLLIILIV